jgi:hypothetical protein
MKHATSLYTSFGTVSHSYNRATDVERERRNKPTEKLHDDP